MSNLAKYTLPTATTTTQFVEYIADCGGTVIQLDPPFGRQVLTDYTSDTCFPIFGAITSKPDEWDIRFFEEYCDEC